MILNTILHVHNSRDLLDGSGHHRRPPPQYVRVLRKQLNHHWFGSAGEVADHILQKLWEFHVQDRLGFPDFGAHIGDDLITGTLAMTFQLDADIACVRFSHRGRPELQAGAARSALHFGRIAQDLLHVGDDAIRLAERSARRHDVVHDETSLIHRGQEIRSRVLVAEVRAADQDQSG